MVEVDQIWQWLGGVADPEIPVISVVDLGIVREVAWKDEELVVTVTPTYSGCPATQVIARDITAALHGHGVERLRLETRLAPPWSTDWVTARGREQLRAFGIAPPGAASEQLVTLGPAPVNDPVVACPRCGSRATECLSQFGSTACKALYRCRECREPFDYFKTH